MHTDRYIQHTMRYGIDLYSSLSLSFSFNVLSARAPPRLYPLLARRSRLVVVAVASTTLARWTLTRDIKGVIALNQRQPGPARIFTRRAIFRSSARLRRPLAHQCTIERARKREVEFRGASITGKISSRTGRNLTIKFSGPGGL